MTYDRIVVIVTVFVLTAWFFVDTLGGVHKGASPRYSLDALRGEGLMVTGSEKEMYIQKIKEAMKRQGFK